MAESELWNRLEHSTSDTKIAEILAKLAETCSETDRLLRACSAVIGIKTNSIKLKYFALKTYFSICEKQKVALSSVTEFSTFLSNIQLDKKLTALYLSYVKQYQDIAIKTLQENSNINLLFHFPTDIQPKILVSLEGKARKRRRENFDPSVFGLRITEEWNNFEANFKAELGKAWTRALGAEEIPTRKVLGHIPKVLDHVENPLIFADFLLETYSSGNEHAVAALKSLFILITKHNLECKDYYKHLYRLLRLELSKAQPDPEYLSLVEKSLGSKSLPEGVLAAFSKRMCHHALISPRDTVLWIVRLVSKILEDRPDLEYLLIGEGKKDRFDVAADIPEKSKAGKTFLHELDLLRAHWDPEIANIVEKI